MFSATKKILRVFPDVSKVTGTFDYGHLSTDVIFSFAKRPSIHHSQYDISASLQKAPFFFPPSPLLHKPPPPPVLKLGKIIWAESDSEDDRRRMRKGVFSNFRFLYR